MSGAPQADVLVRVASDAAALLDRARTYAARGHADAAVQVLHRLGDFLARVAAPDGLLGYRDDAVLDAWEAGDAAPNIRGDRS